MNTTTIFEGEPPADDTLRHVKYIRAAKAALEAKERGEPFDGTITPAPDRDGKSIITSTGPGWRIQTEIYH